jgi:hypothetical protein
LQDLNIKVKDVEFLRFLCYSNTEKGYEFVDFKTDNINLIEYALTGNKDIVHE